MHGGPSGFHNAPITRTFVLASGFLTVIFGIRSRALRLGLSYQEIFKQFKLWRIVSSELAFSSTPELMFGLYLLYYFRVFERQIGSNKYSVFVLFSLVVSFLLQALALFLLKDSSSLLASGPYGLIFASFVTFYADIPVSSKFRVLGINFTNKSFIYLAGFQLLLSSLKRSLLPGICGILAGILYQANVFHVRRTKFPKSISSFFARLAWAPGNSSTATRTSSSRRGLRIIPSNAGHQVEQYRASATRAAVLEPAESSITTLVSMGFDRNSAREALIQARNDINVATNILLGS